MESRSSLDRVRDEMANALADYAPAHQLQGLRADKWVLASGLQKAIRRGEVQTAQSCAATLLQTDKQMLWRRLQVTALEDVGIGDPAAASEVMAASDAAWRISAGGDTKVALYLTERMCEAPKDRSGDYLISAAQYHPAQEDERERFSEMSTDQLLDAVLDKGLPLSSRAVAAWYAAGTDRFPCNQFQKRTGDPGALFAVYCRTGVPEGLVGACQGAARRMRNPLPVLVPLVWLELAPTTHRSINLIELPPTPNVNGIPTYALDPLHTRLGGRAARQWLNSNQSIRDYLGGHAEQASRVKAAGLAIWHVESAQVVKQLTWDRTEELRTAGIEADFYPVGVPPSAVDGLLKVVRENLVQLDEIRVELLKSSQQSAQPHQQGAD